MVQTLIEWFHTNINIKEGTEMATKYLQNKKCFNKSEKQRTLTERLVYMYICIIYLFIYYNLLYGICGMRWLLDYLMNFYFSVSFFFKELSLCFQFFFQFQFWFFFYQWWQIIKQNVVLFKKILRCGWVMMNEWLIMSGDTYICFY